MMFSISVGSPMGSSYGSNKGAAYSRLNSSPLGKRLNRRPSLLAGLLGDLTLGRLMQAID